MKCLLKNLGQIQCAKIPRCFSSNQGFFNALTWGAIALQSLHFPLQSLHFPLQTKPFPPCQSKVLRTKERDDIRAQITKRY